MNRLAWALVLVSWSAAAQVVPDLVKTPVRASDELTQEAFCATKWGKDARHVTAGMKAQVFSAYGLTGNDDPSCAPDKHGRRFEIDHLISRELGGADEVGNLWPQCYNGPWGAAAKDRLENRLHKEMCAGSITLQQAQDMLVHDWRVAYRYYFGEPK